MDKGNVSTCNRILVSLKEGNPAIRDSMGEPENIVLSEINQTQKVKKYCMISLIYCIKIITLRESESWFSGAVGWGGNEEFAIQWA